MSIEIGIILGVAIVSVSGACMAAFIVWLSGQDEEQI